MEKVSIVFSFHPRFAFAETDSVDQIEKAKSAMEGVEIQGRKLRVRRLEKKLHMSVLLHQTLIV